MGFITSSPRRKIFMFTKVICNSSTTATARGSLCDSQTYNFTREAGCITGRNRLDSAGFGNIKRSAVSRRVFCRVATVDGVMDVFPRDSYLKIRTGSSRDGISSCRLTVCSSGTLITVLPNGRTTSRITQKTIPITPLCARPARR